MKSIVLTGIACLAPFIADGGVNIRSLPQNSQNIEANPFSTINRLDLLEEEIDMTPSEHTVAPPVMEEAATTMPRTPPEPAKWPPFTPDIRNLAVIPRAGSEIMRFGRQESRKMANTESFPKGYSPPRSVWNYRRTLESCRF